MPGDTVGVMLAGVIAVVVTDVPAASDRIIFRWTIASTSHSCASLVRL